MHIICTYNSWMKKQKNSNNTMFYLKIKREYYILFIDKLIEKLVSRWKNNR